MQVKRGDVLWVNFEPSLGEEIKEKRPAVVISTDKANPYLNRVVVIPLSSNMSKMYPSETKVTVKNKQSKAMADQIRTVSKTRLISKIQSLTSEEMKRIEEKIKLFLELI